MKRKQLNALLAAISLFSLFFNSVLTAHAQVGFAAEDISEGASVFVFRGSSSKPKSALRAQAVKARPFQKKMEARERRVKQSNLLGVTRRPKNPVATRPTPKPIKTDGTRLAKEKSAEEYAKNAETAFNNKDLDEAENLYAQARAISPDNQTAKLGLAKVFAARGDSAYADKSYRNAALIFNQSIALNPNNADVYAALGETYEAQDQNDKAIEAYLKAMQLDDSLTEINAPLGALYYEKGDFSNAEKYLAKAAAINSNDDDLQNLYGEALLKQNRAEEAARAFQTAIRLNQDNAAAHYNLAKIHAQ
ncbi:MAG TPA: tetratricopeptide repeat protein, partial [Pyrinomonadaceae bacterium]|nr:tetratricopeptide repeat protein [Pyrinomonadaceae bacterium]